MINDQFSIYTVYVRMCISVGKDGKCINSLSSVNFLIFFFLEGLHFKYQMRNIRKYSQNIYKYFAL